MQPDLKSEPLPYEHCAGIRTMKCTGCEFEFVYVTPEEIEWAHLLMAKHLNAAHDGANFMTMAVEIRQY